MMELKPAPKRGRLDADHFLVFVDDRQAVRDLDEQDGAIADLIEAGEELHPFALEREVFGIGLRSVLVQAAVFAAAHHARKRIENWLPGTNLKVVNRSEMQPLHESQQPAALRRQVGDADVRMRDLEVRHDESFQRGLRSCSVTDW